MSTYRAVSRIMLQGLLVISLLLGSLLPAQASSLDSFISTYQKIESYAPSGSLPVSSQDLIAAKSLFGCLEQGSDAGICIDTFSDTPLGQQVVQNSGLPSSFWSLLDAYVAYKSGDYWGVAYSLGEAAVCAVLQVLTGGADICGIIKELVALAASLWDAANAVAEFFADLGEGAWEAAKGAYCATLGGIFGGCDDDSSSPPEAVAYAWVFAPKLADGLAARKAVDPQAFNLVRQQLKDQASANPAQFNIPLPDFFKMTFSPAAVQTAADIYTKTVDQNWTADITKNVLPELSKKRDEYSNPNQIATLATMAANAFKNNQAVPATVVGKQCGDEFRQIFGYAHLDRWLSTPANAPLAAQLKIKSNNNWCRDSLFGGNKPEFAKTFFTFAKYNFCPGATTPLPCKTMEKYEKCVKLLGSVDQPEKCGVNVGAMGKEAAERLQQELHAQGSKGTYTIIAPPTGSNSPAKLVSQRPTQQHACNQWYQNLFGNYPAKLVECTLQEPADYKALRAAVVVAVATLNGSAPGSDVKNQGGVVTSTLPKFFIDPLDPLLVWPKSGEAYEKARNNNQSFGFGPPSKKPNFEFPLFKQHISIDGLDTPAISNEMEPPKPGQETYVPVRDKLGPKNPGDPIDQLQQLRDRTRNTSPVALQSGLEKGTVAAKNSATLATANAMLNATAKANVAAPAMAGAGQQQQVMSGKLPEGKGAPTPAVTMAGALIPAASQAKAPAAMAPAVVAPPAPPMPPAAKPAAPMSSVVAAKPALTAPPPAKPAAPPLPDLTAPGQVTIAGKTLSWQQPVTLDTREATRSANGVCTFPVLYAIRNSGTGAANPFSTLLSVSPGISRVEKQWPAIAAGQTAATQQETISLKPGQQLLTLEIDQKQLVKEANEGNNQYRLPITVTGTCGETKLMLPGRR